jgi:hypothetical protein
LSLIWLVADRQLTDEERAFLHRLAEPDVHADPEGTSRITDAALRSSHATRSEID